ncbi:hypothetical protein HCQ94_01235 [Actinomyces sp. zg-332]|uniref:hypothetical protein n=1 Tax=Actinomyces sp. zg-332 TaxID=2708340 RepID=UPI00141F038D|nr:hypothetical protein [Actinomyces sp. zg-332]QPK94362.1 hypothetical protein HCQ94_01235 [Actinomyces sp. zg-332]
MSGSNEKFNSNVTNPIENRLANKFEEGFEILFTKVIEKGDDGLYKVRQTYKGDL